MGRALNRILVFSALLLLAACTTGKQLPNTSEPLYSVPVSEPSIQQAEMSWWAYRFRITWPEEKERPDFSIDLLLAYTIVKPVLERYSSELPWWRFHRRAARKPPGHQFSFLFYSNQETAREVFKALDESPQLAKVKQAGLINKIVSSNIDEPENRAIEDFSDSSWSPEIQRTWPTFIMGVSAFWLALIDDIKTTDTVAITDDAAITDQLEQYRQIDEKIAQLWEKEGQHSLLHHLGAIFGYKSMLIRW